MGCFADELHGIRNEAAGAARRVVASANQPGSGSQNRVVRIKHQRCRKVNNVTRSQVFLARLVLGVGKSPDELFIEVAHHTRMHVHVEGLEEVHDRKELIGLFQTSADAIELEVIEDVSHILGEPVLVGDQVVADMILPQGCQRKFGSVVEGHTCDGTQSRCLHLVENLESRELGTPFQNRLPSGLQNTLKTTKQHERQNHLAVLIVVERPVQKVCDCPNSVGIVFG